MPDARDTTPAERPPAADVTVREARPRDLPAVAAIEQVAFTDPWSPGSFASCVDNPAVLFLVAEDAGAVAGYLVAWFAADEAEVANVAVAPAWRGRGVGARLLDAALGAAARRGTATVYLEVRESNAVARRLYARRGFAEVGRRRRYYQRPTEDALVLARPIVAGGGAANAGRNETAHDA